MKDTFHQLVGVVTGFVQGCASDGRPLVTWNGRMEAVAANAVWMRDVPDWTRCRELPALLAFEDGDESRPIIVGLLAEPPLAEPSPSQSSLGQSAVEVPERLRGTPEVLRLQSEEEIVLECGKAKIALRKDGRICILGGYLLSRATGVNKVKGASVQIN